MLLETHATVFDDCQVGGSLDRHGNQATAGAGGGISNSGSSLSLFNTTVANNSAATAGGGIQNTSAGVNSLSGTTVAGNSANDGGGLSSGGAGSVQLKNSILSDNAAASGNDCSGSVESLDNNVIEDISGCAVVLAANDINADAALDAFVLDGPGGAHYPLTEISTAINGADDTACTAADQIGEVRVGVCDIGAIEYPLAVQDTNELDVEKTKLTFYYQNNPPASDSITMSGFLRFPALPAYEHPFNQDVSVSVAVGYSDPNDGTTKYVPIYELEGIRDDTIAPAFIATDRDNGLTILRFYAPLPPLNPTRSKVRLEIANQLFQDTLMEALPSAPTYLDQLKLITEFSFEIKFEDGRVWSSTGSTILLDSNEKKFVIGKEK